MDDPIIYLPSFTFNLIAIVLSGKTNETRYDDKLKQTFGIYQCNKQAGTNIVSSLFV